MKTTTHLTLRWHALALALLSILNLEFASVFAAQGTTVFTYQGLLNDRGAAANGTYDFRFTIYDRDSGGISSLEPVIEDRVAVSNGLFTVELDFGALGSTPRWLEIEVRSRDEGGAYTVLAPRQLLSATPRAHYALQAGDVLNPVSEALIPNSIPRLGGTNVFTGPVHFEGSERPGYPPFTVGLPTLIPNLNADYLDGMDASFFWQLFGNTGTTPDLHFVGTRDNQPLELRVNLQRALRFEPTVEDANNSGIVNVIGGSVVNFVGPGRVGATIGGGGGLLYYGAGGGTNSILGDFGTIGGGRGNAIDFNFCSVISGGQGNSIHSRADRATIGGGYFNSIQTNAYNSTIAGGDNNVVEPFAVSSGLGGGSYNRIQRDAHHSVLAGGEGNVIESNSTYSVIGGGHVNTVGTNSMESVIGGGSQNRIGRSSPIAVIDGGSQNRIGENSGAATIGGGALNIIEDDSGSSTIGGGSGNEIASIYNTIAGGWENICVGRVSTIGGGSFNTNSGVGCTLGGGSVNISGGTYSTVGGGIRNICIGYAAVIPGGNDNSASANNSFAAGQRAKALHEGAFVWADSQNADFSSTGSDEFNVRARGGMVLNTDTSLFFGAQTRQMLNLWGTRYGIGIQSATMYFRTDTATASGGFAWYKGGTHVNGQNDAGGGTMLMRLDGSGNLNISGAFGPLSDRNAKENFEPVNPREVLEKVTALPLSKWNYKTDTAARHIGPMAQDFHAAFGTGADDKHIATVDADGVALAAIQGLNQKLTEELKRRDAENAELKSRLANLEKLVIRLSPKE